MQLVLAGSGIAGPGAVLHCRSRGQHQVVCVLRVRRSLPSAVAARLAHQAEAGPGGEGEARGAEAPDTPPPADRASPRTAAAEPEPGGEAGAEGVRGPGARSALPRACARALRRPGR